MHGSVCDKCGIFSADNSSGGGSGIESEDIEDFKELGLSIWVNTTVLDSRKPLALCHDCRLAAYRALARRIIENYGS